MNTNIKTASCLTLVSDNSCCQVSTKQTAVSPSQYVRYLYNYKYFGIPTQIVDEFCNNFMSVVYRKLLCVIAIII